MKSLSSSKEKGENGGHPKGPVINLFLFQIKYFWMNNLLCIIWIYWRWHGKAKRTFSLKHHVVLCLISKACGLRGGQAYLWRKGSELGPGAAISLSLLIVYTVYSKEISRCSSIEKAGGKKTSRNCHVKLPITFVSIWVIRFGLRLTLCKKNHLEFQNSTF